MSVRLLWLIASALWLTACYTAHDVALDDVDESDAAADSALAEDAGADTSVTTCVVSECPALGFGPACCTSEGTCGIDATAFNLGCIDPNSFGGLPAFPQ